MTSLFLKRFFVHVFAAFMAWTTVIIVGFLLVLLRDGTTSLMPIFRSLLFTALGSDVMIGLTLRELRQRYRENSLDRAIRAQQRGLSYENIAGGGADAGRAGARLDQLAGVRAEDDAVSYANLYANKGSKGKRPRYQGEAVSTLTKMDSFKSYLWCALGVFILMVGLMLVLNGAGMWFLAFVLVGAGMLAMIGRNDWRFCRSLFEERQDLRARASAHEEAAVSSAVGQYRKHGVTRSSFMLVCPNCGDTAITVLGRKVICASCMQELKMPTAKEA